MDPQELETGPFFETMSKRRKGYPSETRVKRGVRIVHGDKELVEKVGRNDLCPCGSQAVQEVLPRHRLLLTASTATTTFREKEESGKRCFVEA